MKKNNKLKNRILSILCICMISISNIMLLMPAFAYAETAGDVLVVRVQYYGELGDKIREKASFTRAQLEGMSSSTYYYSNVTRVGTVMSMAAQGPSVMSIIEAAGIDSNSIKNITFRTTDGYTRNFTVAGYMTATKYYYPNLSSNYQRNESGNALTPLEGALEGKKTVPAILAVKYGETKQPGVRAESLSMSTSKTYRFCMGQSSLTEGKQTNPNANAGDITSIESCHSIYGIDVTLSGSPIKGIGLSIEGKGIKVGSQKKVSAKIDVVEAFEGAYTASDLTWKSSDTSIATVDANGNVKVKKAGAFTITATAPDGKTASITINKDTKASSNTKASAADASTKSKGKKVKAVTVNAKEIVLGDVVVETSSPQDQNRAQMSADSQALDGVESYSYAAAVGTAVGASVLCGAGAIIRVIKYKKLF